MTKGHTKQGITNSVLLKRWAIFNMLGHRDMEPTATESGGDGTLEFGRNFR